MSRTPQKGDGPLDLTPIGVFVRVVQAGSFSVAAKQLGMPNSTVSAQVNRLERRLGVTLLHRTTRKINLTAAGQTFFNRAAEGIEILRGAESATSVNHNIPRGTVRLTTASDILPPNLFSLLITELQYKYPEISLEIDLSQRIVDLVNEGFDMAIRATSIIDNRLVARRIGTIRWILVASSTYFKNVPVPQGPMDLKRHSLIEFYGRRPRIWKLQSKLNHSLVDLPGNTTINHLEIIKQLLLSGSGIALLPTYYVADELTRGTLIRVLPEWSGAEESIYAAYPEQQRLAAKTRVVVDSVIDFFQRHVS
ncbi:MULTISPECIES: LysR family transcriptional regulator [unclassified Caballeronia]|uniref:LysR family transcriptional regulator n=1 Tax=unclassified Caballeronia TaxID=2646786 RepID=UPI002860452E|nr:MULTISPECIES: LysR family transcriptional regulator [unclassified Caballeronia]MDR5776924.1 LysR family transcriptional regulator [Caballeronia sp. LZ002]MDR5798769.1 LysR family transcriptional regulator [Caballeronia sp. LZ001]MDR5852291.1 LysR family transcriptional regulator [Caballeronia sp. LZ003]